MEKWFKKVEAQPDMMVEEIQHLKRQNQALQGIIDHLMPQP
jgi:hypothetical protein